MNQIDNYFDKIFVINLVESVERKKNIIEQFNKFNITNFEIFSATDKKDIILSELKEKKLWAYPNNKFNCTTQCTCNGNGHNLSTGDIALCMSHNRIYDEIINKNYEKCLILEDDCIFTDEIIKIESIIENIPKSWELLYLGNSKFINQNNTKDINNSFFLKCFGLPCTHIYAVTKNCAKILKSHMFPFRAAIDGYIDKFVIKTGLISDVYVCTKSVGLNGSLEKKFIKEY